MKNRMFQPRPFAVLAVASSLLTFPAAQAQTYTWDPKALGQAYLACPNPAGPGYPDYHLYYPSNSYWTQSVQIGRNCDNTADVVSEPSNWLPAPAPGVYPGGPGAEGVDVVLGAPANTVLWANANVTVNRLTLQTSGSLSFLGYLTWLTASAVDIQGDTIIGAAPGNSMGGGFNIPPGGTFTKSGGTGTFGFYTNVAGTVIRLYMLNANLVVKSGAFELPYGGGGHLFGSTFSVSNDAALLLTKDAPRNSRLRTQSPVLAAELWS